MKLREPWEIYLQNLYFLNQIQKYLLQFFWMGFQIQTFIIIYYISPYNLSYKRLYWIGIRFFMTRNSFRRRFCNEFIQKKSKTLLNFEIFPWISLKITVKEFKSRISLICRKKKSIKKGGENNFEAFERFIHE